jgi:hypothetical protein
MTSHKKTLDTVLRSRSDANIRFTDLCSLVQTLGFTLRIKGDHYIFWREGVEEIINLQPLKRWKSKTVSGQAGPPADHTV